MFQCKLAVCKIRVESWVAKMANQCKNWSDIVSVVWPLTIYYYSLFFFFERALHEANRVVDRWLGAVSMAVVSTHLELHQLGCHKHLRATASYAAVVCLRDRFTQCNERAAI